MNVGREVVPGFLSFDTCQILLQAITLCRLIWKTSLPKPNVLKQQPCRAQTPVKSWKPSSQQ